MTLRKILKALLPFTFIGLSAFIAYDMVASRPAGQQAQPSEKVWQIEVVPAEHRSLSPVITLYGRVESPDELKAAAPGDSIVAAIYVSSGDRVSKSDLLLRLDDRDFESQRILAESDLSDLQSQIDELKIRHASNLDALKIEQELLLLAEQEATRMRQLKNRNLGSETTLSEALNSLGRQQLSLRNRQLEVDSFPSKLNMLQSRQQQARARLADAKLKIERGRVIAPFDGTISSVEVSAGDRVSTGQVLTTLYPVNSLEIRAHIANSYIDQIRTAIAADKPVFATVKRGDRTIALKLLRLSGDARATGIDAFFAVNQTDLNFRPGELLTLELSLPAVDNVIAVPYQAIYGNSRVYLVREERLLGVDVESVGQIQPNNRNTGEQAQMLIRSDQINSDDKIAITHLPNAVTGLKVRVVE